MHAKVREFLRSHLIRQYERETADLPVIKELAGRLHLVLKEKLEVIHSEIAALDQRYADDPHNRTLTAFLQCLPWVDSREAFQEFQNYLIDLLAFEPTVARELAQEYLSLAPLFSSGDKVAVKKLCAGAIAFVPLTFESSTIPPTADEIWFFRVLQGNLPKNDPEKRALFNFRNAQNLIRQGDYAEALKALQNIADLTDIFTKGKSSLIEELAETCFRLGYLSQGLKPNNEITLAAYNLATVLDPEDATAYNNRGVLLKEMNRKEAALQDYDKAIGLNPEGATAYYNRGNLLQEMNRKEAAMQDYGKAIELNPEDATAYNNRGILLHIMNRKELALQDYDKAIELNPEYAGAYNNRGKLLAEMNRQESALQDYDKGIGLNPEFAIGYFFRSLLLQEMDRKESALKDYDKAIELNPEFAIGYFLRGRLLQEMDRKESALEDYDNAIELNLEFAEAYHNRGLLLEEMKRPESALEDYEKAIELEENALADFMDNKELKNNLASAYGNLSWLQLFLGRFPEAEQSAKRGMELDPEATWINTNLASAFLFQGKFSQAAEIFNRWKDEPYREEKTFQEVFLEDLAELEEAGITHPDVEKVRKMLE